MAVEIKSLEYTYRIAAMHRVSSGKRPKALVSSATAEAQNRLGRHGLPGEVIVLGPSRPGRARRIEIHDRTRGEWLHGDQAHALTLRRRVGIRFKPARAWMKL